MVERGDSSQVAKWAELGGSGRSRSDGSTGFGSEAQTACVGRFGSLREGAGAGGGGPAEVGRKVLDPRLKDGRRRRASTVVRGGGKATATGQKIMAAAVALAESRHFLEEMGTPFRTSDGCPCRDC